MNPWFFSPSNASQAYISDENCMGHASQAAIAGTIQSTIQLSYYN